MRGRGSSTACGKPGRDAGTPCGPRARARLRPTTGWFVADLWGSEESFNQFGEIIGSILRELGIADVQPKIFPAFNVVIA
ncbi:hypothetical protein Scel_44360 [Streptomyces cellostaticus]|nr:hypothetical protein Scel_44360 [Streptomyces cellostaticus]